MDEVDNLLKEFIDCQKYGEVIIKFENGKIVVIKKTESLKLSEKRR